MGVVGYSLIGLNRPWRRWVWFGISQNSIRNSRWCDKKEIHIEEHEVLGYCKLKMHSSFSSQLLNPLFFCPSPGIIWEQWPPLLPLHTVMRIGWESAECDIFVWCLRFVMKSTRVKQVKGVSFRHAFASHLLVFSMIHWPESVLMVHLDMQLLGKEKDKNVPSAILLRFWSKRKQCK